MVSGRAARVSRSVVRIAPAAWTFVRLVRRSQDAASMPSGALSTRMSAPDCRYALAWSRMVEPAAMSMTPMPAAVRARARTAGARRAAPLVMERHASEMTAVAFIVVWFIGSSSNR